MGGGSSYYETTRIEKQEAFVRNNVQQFKEALNSQRRGNIYVEPYSNRQVEGKLRQLYHNSDTLRENKCSYVNDYEWANAKKTLNY